MNNLLVYIIYTLYLSHKGSKLELAAITIWLT